jgi:hypothetical protein
LLEERNKIALLLTSSSVAVISESAASLLNISFLFDVHVTMHCVKYLVIKLTRCTNFSNLFLELNSACFGQFLCPSSGVFHCTHSNGICQQTCMTYTIAMCAVKNS